MSDLIARVAHPKSPLYQRSSMSRYSTGAPAMVTAQQLGGDPNMLYYDPLLTGNQIIQNLIAYGQFKNSNPQKPSAPMEAQPVRKFKVNPGSGYAPGPF